MSQSNHTPPPSPLGQNLPLKGGAALVAPVSAFPGGIPQQAMIVLPLSKTPPEMTEKLKEGALVVKPEQMWEMLGFNGPAVQVQDNEGRPIAIGLEDLLGGLEKHYQEESDDPNRGRMYAQELMKHGRSEKAAEVMGQVVANGGGGEDWLALGVAQLSAKLFDKAEATLRGAQNLLKESAFPSLHLAKALRGQGKTEEELEMVNKAIEIDANCVDAWAYLYNQIKTEKSEDEATKAIEALAETDANKQSAAPFVALQGLFSAKEETREQALAYAKKAVARDSDNVMALISLSALYGQSGDLQAIINLLKSHENKMLNDVRLANNYFEALFQARELDKVTKLLNALAGSNNPEVKQFAIQRSRAVAQFLQQQQSKLKAGVAGAAAAKPASRIIT